MTDSREDFKQHFSQSVPHLGLASIEADWAWFGWRERARHYADRIAELGAQQPHALKEKLRSAEEYIKELEAQRVPEWRPVADSKPRYGQEVLIALMSATGKKSVAVGTREHRTDAEWFVDNCEIANNWDVTHWMPLPAPPAPTGEE